MGISKEYATALFELAAESGSEQEIYNGVCLVKDVFADTPELAAYLASPGIRKDVRLKTVKDTFENDVHEYVVSFLCLLCERKDIEALFECIEEYKKLYEENKNIAHAVVTSAHPLTDDEKASLVARLEKVSGKRVDAEYQIDPELLGGARVEMDGTIIDGSLRHRLESMKEVMIR